MAEARLFALPPGVDFPAAVAAGILERFGAGPPEALARVEVWVNAGRMARAVTARLAEGGARLLPRVRPVAELGAAALHDLPPPVPKLRRRLELAQLVQALIAREPDLAPPAAAWDLAESLLRLMDEMQGEGVDPAAVAALDVGGHSAHWARTQAFLRIVQGYLADAPPDPEGRQRLAAEALGQAWASAPPAHPVVVAGSTGSRGATARFMQAVARLPNGFVVLPGFDFEMPEAAWAALSEAEGGEDHPQFRFVRLLRELGLRPGEVRPWTDAAPAAPARNRLISLALRPAPVTDAWRAEGPLLPELAEATAGLTLIEAPDPRAEATAIALRLRRALAEGESAALITPDRELTRRVAAVLDRWGIRPDDSAGRPLGLTPPGRLLRQVAALAGRKLTAEALLALLKHPLVHSGSARGPHLRATRELELALRREGPVFPTAGSLLARAEAAADPAAAGWARWLADCVAAIWSEGVRPLSEAVAWHLALTERLAGGAEGGPGRLWEEAAGEEARLAMAELAREAPHGGQVAPADYVALIDNLLAGREVREAALADPRVIFLGTLEARASAAPVTILGGLVEGSWPPAPAADPWLNRAMRAAAGLLLPERQIGLSAHDFQQAVAGRTVVLARALRSAEAETVPARWLNRLVTLLEGLGPGGKAALADMRRRGAELLAMARALETPEAPVPRAQRPAPRPPVAARPRQLSVTEITTLIRDPYAVYARHVLGLRPLEPLRPAPDGRLRGEVLHEVMARFIPLRPEETAAEAEARLLALAEEVLERAVAWPSARRLWRAALARVAPVLIANERARPGSPVLIEGRGQVERDDPPFLLTARADRIDALPDGRLHVLDYKSGAPPSARQMRHFDKQLLLEAAMAEKGGFPGLPRAEVARVTHVGLGSGAPERGHDLAPGETEQVWEELGRLLAAYARPDQGYAARRAAFREGLAGEYDHLARWGEWETTDPPVPEDVG